MASFFTSAALGAVRQILFNAQFGAGMEANAYYAAFRLPDTLFSLIAGGALSSAMIPVLLSATSADGERAAWRLIDRVLTLLLIVFTLVVVLGEIFTPFFVTRLLAPGFDAPTSELTVSLTRIMLVQPIVLAFGSVATAVLNSRNRFALTGLSIASHNFSLIAGILFARLVPTLGIYGPTFGVIVGAILQTVILVPGLRGRDRLYRPSLDFKDAHLQEVIRLLIPNGLAVGVGYAGFILDTAFATKARELAGLPAIANAWLLVGLPIALLGQAIGQSAFPRIAAFAAALEWGKMLRTVLVSLGVAVALALPAVAAFFLLGRPLVRLLFEHGKFDASAGALTFSVLKVYAAALPAYVGTEVVTRGLIALRDTRTPLVTNSAQLIGRAAMMSLLVGSRGVMAVPLSLAVTASLETVALLAVFLTKVSQRSRAAGRVPGQAQ
jgi:putative peptidoglycan lipid II flippase